MNQPRSWPPWTRLSQIGCQNYRRSLREIAKSTRTKIQERFQNQLLSRESEPPPKSYCRIWHLRPSGLCCRSGGEGSKAQVRSIQHPPSRSMSSIAIVDCDLRPPSTCPLTLGCNRLDHKVGNHKGSYVVQHKPVVFYYAHQVHMHIKFPSKTGPSTQHHQAKVSLLVGALSKSEYPIASAKPIKQPQSKPCSSLMLQNMALLPVHLQSRTTHRNFPGRSGSADRS